MSAGEIVAAIGLLVLLVPLAAGADHLIDRRHPRHERRH